MIFTAILILIVDSFLDNIQSIQLSYSTLIWVIPSYLHPLMSLRTTSKPSIVVKTHPRSRSHSHRRRPCLYFLAPHYPNSQSPTQFCSWRTSLVASWLQAVYRKYSSHQDGCSYAPEAKPVSHNTTSNLWKHLEQKHTSVYNALRSKPLITNTNSRKRTMPSSFFIPRQQSSSVATSTKYRELLLRFLVSSNLPLSLVDQYSFRQLVNYLNPTILAISTRTIRKDLHNQFNHHRIRWTAVINNWCLECC
jgi:hypothetical protein